MPRSRSRSAARSRSRSAARSRSPSATRIPHDNYGPLNVWNMNRTSNANPGGELSSYNENGTRRTAAEYEAQFPYQPPEPERASRRQAGLDAGFVSDTRCEGKVDVISTEKIGVGLGFLLDCEKGHQHCYSANTIAQFKHARSPMTNAEFTEKDHERLEQYKQSDLWRAFQISRTRSRSRGGRNTRKRKRR